MKNDKKYLKKSKNDKPIEINMNIRKKNLSLINSRINRSIINMNSLISKMNNLKDIVLYNQSEQRDLKTIQSLDNSALYFSKHIRNELNESSDLLQAYGLSDMELDYYISHFKKKPKKFLSTHELIKKFKELKTKKNDEFEKVKKDFDLCTSNNIEENKINKKFLHKQKQLRDLFDLKIKFFLGEQRKKIGKREKFEPIIKNVCCFREKEKINHQRRWSHIKSKYYDKYKLSRSYQDEQEIILNKKNKEEKNINESDENKKSKNFELITSNDNRSKSRNELINNNTNFSSIMENNFNSLIKFGKEKPKFTFNQINMSANNKTLKNSLSFNDNNNKSNSNEILKKINKKAINNSKIFYSKINFNKQYFSERPSKYSANLTPKMTLYSSRASSRPISAFSSYINNTTFLKLNNKNNKNYIFPKRYMNEINNIIKISKINTHNFKEQSKELNLENKKLFKKSYSDVFEKDLNFNLNNVIKEFNFNYKIENFKKGYEIKKDIINNKNIILNNADRVKKLLNAKDKKILDGVLKKLLVVDNKIENNSNFSYNEKIIDMRNKNNVFKNISKDTLDLENKLDNQRVLDIFLHEDEDILKWANEIKNLTKLNEEDRRTLIKKQNIFNEIQRNKIRRNRIDMNFIKKQTLSLLKRKNKKNKI